MLALLVLITSMISPIICISSHGHLCCNENFGMSSPAVQEGKTALMLAAENGRHAEVKFLLENGSDVDQATKVRSVHTEASELSA